MKHLKLDISQHTRIETDIAPPMQRAITLPILIDGKDIACLYVAVSPFSFGRTLSDYDLQKVALGIGRAVNLVSCRFCGDLVTQVDNYGHCTQCVDGMERTKGD